MGVLHKNKLPKWQMEMEGGTDHQHTIKTIPSPSHAVIILKRANLIMVSSDSKVLLLLGCVLVPIKKHCSDEKTL